MKENFGQEHVKRGLLSFQGKIGTIGTISPAIAGKNDSFFTFDTTFPPTPP